MGKSDAKAVVVGGKKVVIIGGGIGGLMTAMRLTKAEPALKVVVVDDKGFFEWPLASLYTLTRSGVLHKAVSGAGGHHVKGCEHVVGQVSAVQESGDAALVELADGRSIACDACVVAVGFSLPTVRPALGATYEQRQEEVARVSGALRGASTCVLISGGGNVAVEFAGEVRDVNPTVRICIVTREARPLMYLDGKWAAKLAKVLERKKIEVLSEVTVKNAALALEKGTFVLSSGQELQADVHVPCYTQGFRAGFLGALSNERGQVRVNAHLQSSQNPRVFAVGCSDVGEFASLVKIDGQAATVVANVLNFLQEKPLKAHKEMIPQQTHPAGQTIGHDSYAWIEPAMLPPGPCLKACGFPVCCPFLCWPLWCVGGVGACHPCACGYCCGDPAGKGTAHMLHMFLHGTGTTGIKGLGQPKQQTMQ